MSSTDNLKIKRRTAKSRLTRREKAVNFHLEENRSPSEVRNAFEEYEQVYEELNEIHDTYAATIADEKTFEEQEEWIEKCQEGFLKLTNMVNDYCRGMASQQKPEENTDEDFQAASIHVPTMNSSSTVKLEKAKMPTFAGNVRDYHTFRGDFLHMVENRYTKRDMIALLRTCLSGKPLEMIRGIGEDFDGALDYLDSVYGDPRFIADAIVYDINVFKPLKNGEDSRFCDLVHLVRRSYNTLKEVNRPQDMDNSQMLALVEKKMCSEDRKVWFRDLEREQKPASLSLLMEWMTKEMKSRMRAAAPVRTEVSRVGSVHQLTAREDTQQQTKPFHKCWMCETSDHWTDQCQKFLTMSQPDRLKEAMQRHVCFSCLKKAGREHRMSTCRRRRQCIESKDGVQCKYYHHPLLHEDTVQNIHVGVKVASITGKEAVLPVIKTEFIGACERVREGNVLLDTGSQISIIRQAIVDDLGLTGSKATVTITKVGGVEEHVQTKMYKVPIRSLDTKERYSISAIALPCISEDIADIPLAEEARQLQLDEGDLHRGSGPVDLLLGIDNVEMHTGETRMGTKCVARKSPLGWVVFGESSRNGHSQIKKVLHSQVTSNTALSEFRSTETMEEKVDEHREAVIRPDDKSTPVIPEAVSHEHRVWRELADEGCKVTSGPSKCSESSESIGGPESTQLSPSDLDDAEMCWSRSSYVEDGIIRVSGGAEECVTSYEQRYPGLLPQNYSVGHHIHDMRHEGVGSTPSVKARQRCSILGVQKLAKTRKHRCEVCGHK